MSYRNWLATLTILRMGLVGLTAVGLAAAELSAQTAADSAGIRQAALDYIQGYYTANAERMERALHPELAKRIVNVDERGRYRLGQMSAMTLVQATRDGGGRDTPEADRHDDVTIFDIYQNAASAKVYASGWIDYLHLAKWRGRWVIVNVLWELNPQRR
jgi:hypothetical protein